MGSTINDSDGYIKRIKQRVATHVYIGILRQKFRAGKVGRREAGRVAAVVLSGHPVPGWLHLCLAALPDVVVILRTRYSSQHIA